MEENEEYTDENIEEIKKNIKLMEDINETLKNMKKIEETTNKE